MSDIRRRPIGSWTAIEEWENAQLGWCPDEPHPVECDCSDCDAERGIECEPPMMDDTESAHATEVSIERGTQL